MVSPIRPLPRRIYLIGGWRRWLVPCLCGPVLVTGLWLLTQGDAENMTAGGAMVVGMTIVIVISEIVMRLTRLEITPEGVVLRQVGYRLESPWSNVRALRTDPRRQGFVLEVPLTSKGARRMAFASGLTFNGAPMYDDTQRELLRQGRLIPIEAFAWHLAHGQLLQELRRYAPYLAYEDGSVSRAPAATATSKTRLTIVSILGFTLVVIAAAIWAVLEEPPWLDTAMSILFSVGMLVLTAQSAYAVRSAWRAREWFMLALFTALCSINTILAVYGLSLVIGLLSRS